MAMLGCSCWKSLTTDPLYTDEQSGFTGIAKMKMLETLAFALHLQGFSLIGRMQKSSLALPVAPPSLIS
jgi:hypothetical protein